MDESKPESMAAPVVQMKGIERRFPGVKALDGVDFDLRAGEVHVLIGENGAGKSTLVKILCGAYAMDRGEIHLDGRRVEIDRPRKAQELGIRTIHQELHLVPHLSVAENIFLGDEPTTLWGFVNRREILRRAQTLLDDLGAGFPARLAVARLGVAERQMVEVAKALSRRARVLIMDEPTSALSEAEIGCLFQVVAKLAARGAAVLYISHRLEEIFRIGHRVTVLRDGRRVATRSIAEVDSAELVRLMTNRSLKDHYPARRPSLGAPLLEAQGLTRLGRFDNVSFTLHRGEVLGLAGLIGAGRTAVARALFGADHPDSGHLQINGELFKAKTPSSAIRRGVGLLPEDRKSQGLVLRLSVEENIGLPNYDALSRWGWIRRRQLRALAARSIEELDIKTPDARQTTLFLSGGNQQKVAIAKWLARRCAVLIFDEPTRGIDVGAKYEIYQLINRLAEQGAGIILISSDLDEVLGMSDRVLVMREGRIVEECPGGEASQQRVLQAAMADVAS